MRYYREGLTVTLRRFQIPEAHDRLVLRNEIVRRVAIEPAAPSHNCGGWRSRDDLFEWPTPAVLWLQREIEQHLSIIEIRGWAIVNPTGASHGRHRHREDFTWAGVYYVDPGGEGSARTIFDVGDQSIVVEPEVNLLVVFPSSTWHLVEPHRGPGLRITVAFDAR